MTTRDLRLVSSPAADKAGDAPAPESAGFRYWAFVSYSHRDAKAAAALQRALETYRLPQRLVGRTTAAGPVPETLKPVFRDRDELPAATDLKAAVREALGASRWLIVVCSPAAAQSPWVNREIAEFKRVHGESRVLAVIVDGEPFASRTSRLPGRDGEECFPAALRFAVDAQGEPNGEPLEPIAVDLRPRGDGKRLALLKLVAGMTGVGVDELARRDAQRRARRLAWLALGATAGMVVMAVLTVLAVQARNDAQRQHAQAEDLIEFMLGDLRKKLEPVGRLDVLDAVGEKALAHYAAQRADALDANELGRRSRALHVIGEIREKRGNLDAALQSFQRAAETTGLLLARAPDDGQRVFDHAQSVYWVGYVAWKRRQVNEAEAAFREYDALTQRLAKIDPQRIDWVVETAYAKTNLAVLFLETDRAAAALDELAVARETYVTLVGHQPDLNLNLANAYGWISAGKEDLGDFDGAIEAQRAKMRVLGKVPDAEKDRRVQQLIGNANFEVSRLQLILADTQAARRSAQAAVALFDGLYGSDASNLEWLSELCHARFSLAEAELAHGEIAAARRVLALAASDTQRLMAADPTSLPWHVGLRGRTLMLGAAAALADGRAYAIEELERYLAHVRGVEAAGKPLSAAQNQVVARVQLALGDLLARDGVLERARNAWQAVAKRSGGAVARNNPRSATVLAAAEVRLGNIDAARALAAGIKATNYRHPDYADLLNRLARAAGARAGQSS